MLSLPEEITLTVSPSSLSTEIVNIDKSLYDRCQCIETVLKIGNTKYFETISLLKDILADYEHLKKIMMQINDITKIMKETNNASNDIKLKFKNSNYLVKDHNLQCLEHSDLQKYLDPISSCHPWKSD